MNEDKITNVKGYWAILNSFDRTEFEKLFKDLDEKEYREFIRNKIEHIIMQYPIVDIFYECPKCRYRVIHEQKKPFFLESLVDYFLEQTLGLARQKLISARRIFLEEINKKAVILQDKFEVLDKLQENFGNERIKDSTNYKE